MQSPPLLHRLSANLYVQSVREAFICLIPYLILISALTLIVSIVQTLALAGADHPMLQLLVTLNRSTYLLFPLAMLLALTFTLSKNLQQPPIATTVLALACFICLGNQLIDSSRLVTGGYFDAQPYAIALPFATVLCMRWVNRKLERFQLDVPTISTHLHLHLHLIVPYLISFALIVTGFLLLNPVLSALFEPLLESLHQSSTFIRGLVRVITNGVFWFIGVHGDNTYGLLIDSYLYGQPVTPSLLMGDFYVFFCSMGGSGNGLSLILATLLFSRDSRSRKIAWLSAPFALFNINEILLFGLPVVLNPYLAIPFILVPTISYLCAYTAVQFQLVSFAGVELSWITPTLLNTGIAGNGYGPLLLQLFLLWLGAAIYAPFVRMSHLYNHDGELAQELANKLSVAAPFQRSAESTAIPSEQRELSVSDDNLLEDILTGDLQLRYRPIIERDSFEVCALNAELYLTRSDGSWVDTAQLNRITRSAIVEVLQRWQFEHLADDLELWRQAGVDTRVYLAANRTLLSHHNLVEQLCQQLGNFDAQVGLELAQSELSGSEQLRDNLERLHRSAIELILDVRGDNTSLEALMSNHIDGVLFAPDNCASSSDKLTDIQHRQLFQLCQNLGRHVRLCQLDEPEQLRRSLSTAPDMLQGEAISSPLSAAQVCEFMAQWQPDRLLQSLKT